MCQNKPLFFRIRYFAISKHFSTKIKRVALQNLRYQHCFFNRSVWLPKPLWKIYSDLFTVQCFEIFLFGIESRITEFSMSREGFIDLMDRACLFGGCYSMLHSWQVPATCQQAAFVLVCSQLLTGKSGRSCYRLVTRSINKAKRLAPTSLKSEGQLAYLHCLVGKKIVTCWNKYCRPCTCLHGE